MKTIGSVASPKLPSPVMKSFTLSLCLLVAALAAFFFVMLVPQRRLEVPNIYDEKNDPVEALNVLRRQSLRQRLLLASRSAAMADNFTAPIGLTADAGGTAKMPPKAVGLDQKSPAPTISTSGLFDDAALDPKDAEIQRAISFIDSGQVDQAIAVLEDLLKNDPRNESALVELAMVYLLDLRQPEQALSYLQKVMDVNPQNQIVLSELVSLYEEQGRLEEGLQFLIDINGRNPDAPELSYGIGQLLSMQGRDKEAISYLEKATASPENAVRAYRDLAEAYARSGDSQRAIDAYDKAIRSQEKDISEKTAQGLPISFAEERLNYTKLDKVRALVGQGEVDKAQEVLDEVSRSMPDDQSVTALQEQLDHRRRAGHG